MLSRPSYIPETLSDTKLTYKWNSQISVKLSADLDAFPLPLARAVQAVNYKAKMAIGLVCLEWMLRRIEGLTDISDPLYRIEAAWASIVDPLYTKSLDFDDVRDDIVETGNPDALRQMVLMRLDFLHFTFVKGRTSLEFEAIKCANIGKYVMPKDSQFAEWVDDVLVSLANAYPCAPAFDRRLREYDYHTDPSVPREWFENTGKAYDGEHTNAAWNTFLSTLDHEKNMYLQKPEDMISEGFKGTPYVLK